MNIGVTFLEALVVALGGGVVAGLVMIAKTLFSMKLSIDKLVVSDALKNESIAEIAAIQHPQLQAHRATLEALKGNCNGNVDAAHELILGASERYNDFLAKRLGGVTI